MTSKAEQFKTQGNEFFQKGKYQAAIDSYTQAINAAQNDDQAKPAIYLTNRSAAYFALKQWNKSLDDATNATLKDPKWGKAYWRQSLAYSALGKNREALEVLLECRSILGESMDPSIQEDIKKSWQVYIDDYYRSKTKNLPVQVKWIDELRGRGVFNLKEVTETNVVVFRDKPFVNHVRPGSHLKHCGFCLKTRLTAQNLEPHFETQWPLIYDAEGAPAEFISCSFCSPNDPGFEQYCSESCKNLAFDQYHSLLCPKMEFWTEGHEDVPHPMQVLTGLCTQYKPPHTNPLLVLRMLAMIILHIAANGGTKKSVKDALQPFRMFQATQNEEVQETANIVITCIKTIISAKYKANPELLNVLDEVINTTLYQELHGIITRNAHSSNPISDFHLYLEKIPPINQYILASLYQEDMAPVDLVNTDFMKSLTVHGTGLFDILSSINHSCDPNLLVFQCHNDHTTSLISLKPIAHGEEFTISYIDETLPKSERQKLLKKFYHFDCNCKKCESE